MRQAYVNNVVKDVSESLKEIEAMNAAIRAITEQTNLLALNAAIEAARAGEAGKGFAVVAEEISQLAKETAVSAKQINDMIDTIKNNTNIAVKQAENTANIVTEQEEAVLMSQEIFDKIITSVENLNDGMEEIFNNISKVNDMKDNVVGQVSKLSAVFEETAAGAEEVAALSLLSIYFILYEKVYNVSKVMKMRKYKNQFEKMTQTPIPQLILTLSLPTTLSMLVTNIYNMADTLFVSHLGTSASGAIGIVFGLMAILQAFGFMFGHGAGSNISRRLGARKVEEARKFASTSFYLSIFFGICISIFGFVFNNPLLYLLGSTDTILPYAKTYAFFILLAAPAMTSSCVMNNILRYEGKATFAMIGLVSGGILNIFGDALFMYGMNMGIEGAGLSTAISQYISAFILFSMFLRKKTQSRFYIKDFTRDYHDVLNIIAVGMPSMMRQGLNSVSTMVLNQQASVYGDAAIAAMSIIARICNFIFSFGLGIAQGFQPVSAFNYGAKLYKRVKESYFFTVIFSVCLIAVVSIICFIFSTQFISMFRNDTDVISIGTSGLRLQCATLIFLPISVCSNMLFQSMGKSSQATFLAAMRSGMCFIPLIYILPHLFGITGIILAQPVSDVVSALISIPFVYHFFKELSASKTANI